MSSTTKNVDDRLSMLPGEVLSHILSLLPTRLVVQTSTLSKIWRSYWLFIMNLDLDDNRVHLHEIVSFMTFMDRVLNFPRTSHIKLFRLNFSQVRFPRSCVSKWIDEAVRLNVRELDIQVFVLELPLSMFTCKTLTLLKLKRGEHDLSVWECPSLVSLPCLKTLDIAVYGNPCGNAMRLIQGCPILESLSLEVTCCESEELIFNIPTLKRLRLTLLHQAGCTINNVVLTLPNLESLFVGGELTSYFVMEDVSSLVEASVLASRFPHNELYDGLLKGVRGVESLLIQTVPSDFVLPIFPNMKHLELTTACHTGQVIKFLENSPVLEHLCIEQLEGPPYWDEECELESFKFQLDCHCHLSESEAHH